MFKVLQPEETSDFQYLSQMHNLRYRIFYKNLKWINGLQIHSQMEFDQYDHEKAKYLVHINQSDCVDACARLTLTDQPYLLGHSFSDYIQNIHIPNSPNICEISRLCADNKTAPKLITANLMACMLEYGLETGITQYVSLSDVRIVPIVHRFGWQAKEIGKFFHTGTDVSVALSYDVTPDFYTNVKNILHINENQKLLGNSSSIKELQLI